MEFHSAQTQIFHWSDTWSVDTSIKNTEKLDENQKQKKNT